MAPHIILSLCHTATKQPQAPSFSPQWSQNIFVMVFALLVVFLDTFKEGITVQASM
jgi:hypothetical protein